MDTEARLAAYALVLRELVHAALARIVEEPWLHDKRTLARHAADDAALVSALIERLAEEPPPAAATEGADPYAEVKPALAAVVRDHLAEVDLVAAPGDAELLERLAGLQELHVVERPARHAQPASALDVTTLGGEPLRVSPAPAQPARDPFVEAGPGGEGLHAQLNAAVLAGEIAARTAHEHPEAPWAFHADLTRLAADRLAATAALDAALAAEGRHWGEQPVALGSWQAVLTLDMGARLALVADPADPAHGRIADRWSS